MEPLRVYEPDDFFERRASRRVEVTCEAVLETMTSRASGSLWDISESGARLAVIDPPQAGSTALLRWAGREAVCTVIWSENGQCGVSFARALDPAVVVETASVNRVIEMPIAHVGNIAQGRKRSAFRASFQTVADVAAE
ncbi:hypothetical protein GRI40_01915 [Altererythrobacter aerius]|uniref:PilZ domain-containing protein n=1 Tax=Tsuneonella aeria TaxID=1837929 RepID=A0A6I4TBC2_9SPHN|nr:PilZ domain-containing protein [Tsuneonella aeria]MXO73977.1 hypothetical protein [Tsuneonella aeria]